MRKKMCIGADVVKRRGEGDENVPIEGILNSRGMGGKNKVGGGVFKVREKKGGEEKFGGKRGKLGSRGGNKRGAPKKNLKIKRQRGDREIM